jgi:capsular exopolysaccharide synthesis family protein
MTVQIEAPFGLPLESRPPRAESDGITVGQILSTLRRRHVVLVATVVAITSAGFIALKTLTPTFTSIAVIVLSARQDNVVDMQKAYLQTQSDAVTRSEADALQSRTLVDRVIDRENLVNDPEFNVYARPFKPNLLTRSGIADRLPGFLARHLRNKPLDPSRLTEAQLKYGVASRVLKALDVTGDTKTYTVRVSFTSADAEKASRIANAFVEEYLKSQVDDRIAAANRAAGWINAHLAELKTHVDSADRAVEAFREANNIVDYPSAQAEGNTLALQQIQNIAHELATARATRAQLEAAHQEVEKLIANPDYALSAPAVASAPVVENLHIQEVTAAARLAELSGTYADGHPLIIDAKSALKKLREQLKVEARRAVQQLEVQMHQAQASEAQLQARLDQLTAARHGENRVLPRLRQLEAEQASARSIYNTFQTGLYRAIVEDGVPAPRGRIIQRAYPTDWPSFPNIPVYLAVIFVASVMVGVGAVFVAEARDKSFRTADALEDALGMPVLGMTLLAPKRLRRLVRRRAPISGEVLAEPTSAMSEAVRHARAAIALTHRERPPKVVMVTSAVPGEGKTTFALMLARLSAQAGKRVLAIEAELRKPTFAEEFDRLPEKGLAEYLLGRAALEEVVGVDPASGVNFIAIRERSKFAGELLGSPQMAALLRQVSGDYDLVVVDTPPAMIVADAFELGHMMDSAVLVVKWGSTPRHMVLDAARKLRLAGVPLDGAVMTQVDSRRYASYGQGPLPYEYAKSYYATR